MTDVAEIKGHRSVNKAIIDYLNPFVFQSFSSVQSKVTGQSTKLLSIIYSLTLLYFQKYSGTFISPQSKDRAHNTGFFLTQYQRFVKFVQKWKLNFQSNDKNREHLKYVWNILLCLNQSDVWLSHKKKNTNHKTNYHYGLQFIHLASGWLSFPTQKIILVFTVFLVSLNTCMIKI